MSEGVFWYFLSLQKVPKRKFSEVKRINAPKICEAIFGTNEAKNVADVVHQRGFLPKFGTKIASIFGTFILFTSLKSLLKKAG